MIVVAHVNDLLITGNDSMLIQETKQVVHQHFKSKDMGELRN